MVYGSCMSTYNIHLPLFQNLDSHDVKTWREIDVVSESIMVDNPVFVVAPENLV